MLESEKKNENMSLKIRWELFDLVQDLVQ